MQKYAERVYSPPFDLLQGGGLGGNEVDRRHQPTLQWP